MIGLSSLFSLPEGLQVERIELQGNLLAIAIVSVLPSSCCPLCSQGSSQVHSWYQRTLRDVPCAGRHVVFHLSARKFFCRNQDCARKIFTERLPTFVEPWAQVTKRLFEAVQAVGFATSGELGTRLADRIGLHSSPTTMLRRMMDLASPSSYQVSLLGIDPRDAQRAGTSWKNTAISSIYGFYSFYWFHGYFDSAAIELESILSSPPVFQQAEVFLALPQNKQEH